MHAFWTVLLVPMFLIGARVTVVKTAGGDLSLRPGSAVRIWRRLFLVATVMLSLVVIADVSMWLIEMFNTQGGAGKISVFAVFMRALFRCLTAIDFPVVQIWAGTLAGYGVASGWGGWGRIGAQANFGSDASAAS